jgi:hypothetical protein
LRPAGALAVPEWGKGAIYRFINHNLRRAAAAANGLFTALAAFSTQIQRRGGVAHDRYSVSA